MYIIDIGTGYKYIKTLHIVGHHRDNCFVGTARVSGQWKRKRIIRGSKSYENGDLSKFCLIGVLVQSTGSPAGRKKTNTEWG